MTDGTGGSNDEVEQTLNQLLACMDGLDSNKSGVIVIAATNRYEVRTRLYVTCICTHTPHHHRYPSTPPNNIQILDDALTRPGRLDRIVRVELPDRTGREAILRVHARKMPLAAGAKNWGGGGRFGLVWSVCRFLFGISTDPLTNTQNNKQTPTLMQQTDVDLSKVAQLTPGLAGADLASLVNEAAIRAVRRGSAESVTMFDMDMAVKDYFRSRGTGKGVDVDGQGAQLFVCDRDLGGGECGVGLCVCVDVDVLF